MKEIVYEAKTKFSPIISFQLPDRQKIVAMGPSENSSQVLKSKIPV